MKNLRKLLVDKNIDIAIFYNIDTDSNKNIIYFSGYKGIGALIISKKSSPFLVVPKMEYEKAKHGKIKVYLWGKGIRLFEAVNLILKKRKIRVKIVGIVERDFSLDVYKSMRKYIKKVGVKDISIDILNLRSIKKEDEIGILRKACKISSDIMNDCISNFKKFKTEEDVVNFLHVETVKKGCELSFDSIVASGRFASMPHYVPRNTKIRKGFCVIDYGAKYKGYHGDITRTVYVGVPSMKEKEIYSLMHKTQEKLISEVKVGIKCSKLYERTLELLGKYKNYFTHGLGHGIGLDIHEYPNLTLDSSDKFQDNQVFTIEPGIYYAGKFGIRIEDDILLKNGKPIILSKVSKNLRIII